MEEILSMLMPGILTSLVTMAAVEYIAWKRDKSGVTGFIWGTVLAILTGSIVHMLVLVNHVNN